MPTFTEQFLIEIADHKMHVFRDDGVYRHIRFKRPDTGCMHFDLGTWPGHLCYFGDMGTYVFNRLEDMFQFFRRDDGPNKYRIDMRYWAEKCEIMGAADRSGIKEFSEDLFARNVKDHLIQWIRYSRDSTTKSERRELWDEVMFEVVGADGGYRKQIAAHDFTHKFIGGSSFAFNDFFERSSDEFTTRFKWCCHALAWAVSVYDNSKQTQGLAA